MVDLELSIGDYVLTGGELPALVVIDALIRLLPGAIDAASTDEESFADGILEYPQYTRPAEFEGASVPAILSSGDHGAVRRWRRREALRRTLERRPDLLAGRMLGLEDQRSSTRSSATPGPRARWIRPSSAAGRATLRRRSSVRPIPDAILAQRRCAKNDARKPQ